MQTEISVEIDRPIAEVFEFTNDHVADWSKTVVAIEMLDEKPEGIGSTFRCITEEKGRKMEFEGICTKHDPLVASSVFLKGQYFDIQADYTFEDLSGRTKVTQCSTVTGKGFFKVMFALFGWAMNKSSCKAQESELENLKRILESGDSVAASSVK